jgi:hypothetical protein
MNLPNYFLADLPPEAELTATMIAEACQTLKHNRAQYLAPRSTLSLIELLADVASNWLDDQDPFRRLALEQGPTSTGFSLPTWRRGLDTFFRRLTPDGLRGLVEQELGHLDRLDRYVAGELEYRAQRMAIATGPELLVHLTAGNLPIPALMSMTLGLLTRSAQFVKCARGTTLLPRLFAHSLYAIEPKIGSCLELADWPGGNLLLENALFAQADCVTATGSDDTLETIRRRLPPNARFVAHGTRVSFGYVAREMLSRSEARQIAALVASDVAAWDQAGCLSPHLVYVENGGSVGPPQFAEYLAQELAKREQLEPRGRLSIEAAAAIATRRSAYEVRASRSLETRHWQSEGSTAWTVIYESDPLFQLSCLNRFIYVKSVRDLTEALHAAATVQGKVSTVGLAACGDKARELTIALARWGATRVCPLGRMQDPPLVWRHDGRPALGELVTWTDWEL